MSEHGRGSEELRLPALLKMMADQLPAVVWAVDTDLRFTVSIGAGLVELGLHPSEVVGKTLYEYFGVHDERAEPILSHREALRGEPRNLEFHWHGRFFQTHLEPLVDANLAVIGVIGVAHDITERKLAEDALRDNEERFRNVFEDGPLGVALLGLNGRILRANRRLTELLGYSQEELIELGVPGISHPDDLALDEQLVRQLLAGTIPSYTLEKRYICRDGSVIWARLTVSVTRDSQGHPTHIVGMTEDITERRLAEERLREAHDTLEQKVLERTRELFEANRKLSSTLESITDGFVAVDRDWRFVYLNSSAARLLNINRDELLGKNAFEEMPTVRELECVETLRCSMNEGTVGHFEQYFAPNDAWYEGHSYPSPEGLSIYFRDITPRKHAQAAIRRQQEAMRRMVLASDHERRLITYELHDGIAQRLVASLMFFQALEQQMQEGDASSLTVLREGMLELERASNELRRLMSGLRTPVLDNFGLVEAIGDVAAQMRARPQSPLIEYSHQVAFGRLDATLENSLFRIAQEAIMNACRHSFSPIVRVTLAQHADRGVLEVRDWGVGFEQGEKDENRFGLDSIVERARLLGAVLQIDSQPGQGTTVLLDFPIVERIEPL